MEHWRFFVAILLLFILLLPIHEYFTENDANIFNQRISGLEDRTDSLNNVYDSNKLLDISKNITDVSLNITYLNNLQIETKLSDINTKINKLGTVMTFASPDLTTTTVLTLPRTASNNYVAYTFTLPVGKWLVTANIVYAPTQLSSITTVDTAIGVAINPSSPAIPDFNSISFPRTKDRYSRFSVSATITVTNATTPQNISIYEGAGKVKVTVICTQIGI